MCILAPIEATNRTVPLFGIRMQTGNREQIERYLLQRIQNRQGGWVVTLNLEMISLMVRSKEYEKLLKGADVYIADGMSLVWLSRLHKNMERIAERTTGVDLVESLLSKEDIDSLAVIGGKEVQKILERLGREGRDYIFDGEVSTEIEFLKKLERELKQWQPKVVFLALGVPKQDKIASYLKRCLPEAVILGVGGSFELLGGTKKRAPVWMQSSGLEWFFRLVQEPRRLAKRYLLEYPFGALYLTKEIIRSHIVLLQLLKK